MVIVRVPGFSIPPPFTLSSAFVHDFTVTHSCRARNRETKNVPEAARVSYGTKNSEWRVCSIPVLLGMPNLRIFSYDIGSGDNGPMRWLRSKHVVILAFRTSFRMR